jgi:Fe-S-cluster-containing hydrogenase component 2
MVCSLYHFGECNPERSAIRVIRNEGQGLAEPLPVVCRQCDAPACMDACPADAIYRDEETGIVKTDPDTCTGCAECVEACPAGCILLDIFQQTPIICDLCGGDPKCVPMCHAGCLQIATAAHEAGLTRVQCLLTLMSKASTEASKIPGEEK